MGQQYHIPILIIITSASSVSIYWENDKSSSATAKSVLRNA